MQSFLAILMVILFSLLTSCGFKPVYKAENNKTYEFLQRIEISDPDTLEESEFYNQLKNIFPASLPASYVLDTKLQFSKDFSVIQKNSDILREIVTLRVSYTLKEKVTGKIITSGKFTRLSSYSTTFSPYSNSTKNQQVIMNLAIISAEEIRNRIILYMKTGSRK